MRFTYTAREADPGKDGVCWLLTNGLGGYASTSAAAHGPPDLLR